MGALLSLFATIGVDINPFERGMNKLSKSARGAMGEISRNVKGQLAAIFGVAAVEEFARRTINAMTKIKDQSEQFSITTDEVQKLDVAAKKIGLTFEDFGSALSKMGGARKEAVQSNLELRNEFEKFGVTVEDLNNPALRNIDILEKMSNSVRGLNATAADAQALRDLLGKGGDKLLQAMREFKNISDSGLFNKQDIEDVDRMAKAFEAAERSLMVMASKWMPALLIGAVNMAAALFKSSDLNQRRSRANELLKHYGATKNQEGYALAANFLNAQMGLGDVEQAQMFGQLEDYASGKMSGLNKGKVPGYKRLYSDQMPSATNPKGRDSGAFMEPGRTKFEGVGLYDRQYERELGNQAGDLDTKAWEVRRDMAFKKKSPSQQIAELERRRKSEETAAFEYEGNKDPNDRLQYSKHKLNAQNLQAQIQDLMMGQKNSMSFDGLSRIGGFNAFSDVGIKGLTVQQQQLATLRSIAGNTKKGLKPHGGTE